MKSNYTHLNTEERVTLMLMRRQGDSLRVIAQVLGRSPSSLSRELRRNTEGERYDVSAVVTRARQLRHRPRRQRCLRPCSDLFQIVTLMLARLVSPTDRSQTEG